MDSNQQSCRRQIDQIFLHLFLDLCQHSPVDWYSKEQAKIKTKIFSMGFVAMKTGADALQGLRYKLRMIGVAKNGASHIYGVNIFQQRTEQ